MADMEKIRLFMYEKCNFPSHNEYLEFDGSGKYLLKKVTFVNGQHEFWK